MKKELVIIVIILLAVFSIIGSANIKASEDDYSFNGYSFGFYDTGLDIIFVKIVVDCDYPEGIPHYYEPFPDWNPGYFETYEDIRLTGPDFESDGDIDTGIFFTDIDTPTPGEYQFRVIDNGTDVLFTHNFTISEKYEANVSTAKWITDAHSFSISYGASVDEKDIDSIGGIQLSLDLINLGDIPFAIGSPNNQEMNILYQMNLYKGNNPEPIYSTEVKKLGRPNNLFPEQDYQEQNFFKSGETIQCTDNIKNQSINPKDYGAGTYSIDGYVQFDDNIYEFSATDVLTIAKETGVPGFEIIFVIFAIALVSLLKRKYE